MKDEGLEDKPNKNNSLIKPLEVMKALSNVIRDKKTVVVTGVGCHQHWAARHLPFKPNRICFYHQAVMERWDMICLQQLVLQ